MKSESILLQNHPQSQGNLVDAEVSMSVYDSRFIASNHYPRQRIFHGRFTVHIVTVERPLDLISRRRAKRQISLFQQALLTMDSIDSQ